MAFSNEGSHDNVDGDPSQVFVALVTSMALFAVITNLKPYIDFDEDLLAQALQLFITFVLAVGLLSLTHTFHGTEYGVVLVVAMLAIFGSLLFLILSELHILFQTLAPETYAAVRVR